MELTGTSGRFDIICRVHGGGITGQAGAMRMGIARALVKSDPDLRPELKRAGYLTRDPRMKERKKIRPSIRLEKLLNIPNVNSTSIKPHLFYGRLLFLVY